MLRIVKNIRSLLFLAGMVLPFAARAAEITAIDFNGKIIGQVISTGMVINADGDNIGSITADSLILDTQGRVIGGVVPQGIVIGMDNQLLGKIHSDGVVRSLSGKNLGRSLPNGLVIDDMSNVIGAVLYPGIVYSPEGEAIGRLTGGGEYTNLEGQHIGFVSANGFAYRKSGEEYVLDGKLMSSKMVVSVDGKFLGSIAPTGQIIDFEGKAAGKVHANGYAYDAQGNIIGSTIVTSYAFSQSGNYMGIVGYNGEVREGERVIAHYRADGNLVRETGDIIGFAVDIATTANDNHGQYLGYVVPNGAVVHGGKEVGYVGAKGYIYDDKGVKIGSLIKTGPVFDSLAQLKGQSMKNGRVISLGGGNIGHMDADLAYDANGTLMGGTVEGMIAFDGNKVLGMANIDAGVVKGAAKNKISPFGYVFAANGKVIGSGLPMSAVYGAEGVLYSYINPNGGLYRAASGTDLTDAGIVRDSKNYQGSIVNPRYALDFAGQNLGKFANSNIILNEKGDIAYKVIPGGYVVETKGNLSPMTTPIKGFSGDKIIALDTGGDLIGYADSNGRVIGTDGDIYGHVIYNEYVADSNNVVKGKMVPFAKVVNEKCAVIGVVNGKGDIVNDHNVIVGRILTNGQAVSDVGSYIGYTVSDLGLIDYDGNFSGTVSAATGKGLDGQTLGCVNRKGIITDDEKQQKYGVITPERVIGFDNKIFAQVLADGRVVDSRDSVIGYMQPDGNVVSPSKQVLGNVMRYKVAYKNSNEFLGMVDSAGQVVNSKGKVVGTVNFDGSVENNGVNVGYALYDFYVYDENFIVYGYLTKDGTVLSPVGSKLGQVDRGFVVDRRGEVVARGNRDYLVRDASKNVVGELLLNGTVVNKNGNNIGYLRDGGNVRDADENDIATATPYQYYVPGRVAPQKPVEPAQQQRPKIQPVEPQPGIDTGTVGTTTTTTHSRPQGMGRIIVGIAITPDGDIIGDRWDNDTVTDAEGNVIGYVMPDGTVVDLNYQEIGMVSEKEMPQIQPFIPPTALKTHDEPEIIGGGQGPGGRYDPQRLMALRAYQASARSNTGFGQLAGGKKEYSPSAFTGYEEDGWPGQDRVVSSWRVDMSEMILEDKGIPAVLARSVYASEGLSDNIPITAIVERNVFAEEGRNIIIPAGSRVIGKLEENSDMAGDSGGAIKVGIKWERLVRPDGSQWVFREAVTADAQGRAGAIGYLDEQLMKKYTLPIVSTALQGLLNIALVGGGSETTTTGFGQTTTTKDARSQAYSDARDEINDQIKKIVNEIMKSKQKIKAVAYVPAGTRIIIYPNQDLWLNSVERSKTSGQGDKGDGKGEKADVFSSGEDEGGSVEVQYDGTNVQPVSAPNPQPTSSTFSSGTSDIQPQSQSYPVENTGAVDLGVGNGGGT